MKKVFFTMIFVAILLVAVSIKTNAETINMGGTETSVDAGSEFDIVLNFEDKITAANAHITYDKSLITFSENDNSGFDINPNYKDGEAAVIYSTLNASKNTFKFRMKAAEVTEEKVATIKITDIQYTTDSIPTGAKDDTEIKITIKPKKTSQSNDSKVLSSNTSGSINTNSINQKNDLTVAKTNHPQTGESKITLIILSIAVIFSIISGLKMKKKI